MVTEFTISEIRYCAVCSARLSSRADRCLTCRWPSAGASRTDGLTDRELASYRARLELARSRWREFGCYDQSPRWRRPDASGTPDLDSRRFAASTLVTLSNRDVKASLSSNENSIGGGLL